MLALVPHFQCEEWLGDCLDALTEQTRPPDGIAVIDDGSPEAPLRIVRRFPQVTLLQARENGGPYRLIQTLIQDTGYDAYLFNDADDWSAPCRLERLLETAEQTGAELVGSWEVRLLCREGDVALIPYPSDVNEILEKDPCALPLLLPTSLVGRDLVVRTGGFAGGMRFSGDAEFLCRAHHVARVVNAAEYLYVRRERDGGPTSSSETGLRSGARREVQERLWARARENAARVQKGDPPVLDPLAVASPAELHHLAGPRLVPCPRAVSRVHSDEGGTKEPRPCP